MTLTNYLTVDDFEQRPENCLSVECSYLMTQTVGLTDPGVYYFYRTGLFEESYYEIGHTEIMQIMKGLDAINHKSRRELYPGAHSSDMVNVVNTDTKVYEDGFLTIWFNYVQFELLYQSRPLFSFYFERLQHMIEGVQRTLRGFNEDSPLQEAPTCLACSYQEHGGVTDLCHHRLSSKLSSEYEAYLSDYFGGEVDSGSEFGHLMTDQLMAPFAKQAARESRMES